MQKSYIVKSPINFADFGFFVRVGDILVHDTSNNNRLTVFRNGNIVKAITQTALGITALIKSEFIVEAIATLPKVEVVKPVAKKQPTPIAPTVAELQKRVKATKEEISPTVQQMIVKDKEAAKPVREEIKPAVKVAETV